MGKDKSDKQEKLEAEYTQRQQEKEKKISDLERAGGSLYEIILTSLEKPPFKTEITKTRTDFINLVNKYLNQLKMDSGLEKFLSELTEDQTTILLEVVLKNLQLISEGNASTSATLMLKLHTKILEKKGISYQLRAITRRHPL